MQYCDGWFRAKKRPGALWTREQAQAAFNARSVHAVVVGPLGAPRAFIEFNNDYVGVGFLDRALRENLSYSFQELVPGRLFLSMATHRTFADDSDRVSAGTTYLFKTNGTVAVVQQHFPSGATTEKETSATVSGNWEDYPQFGRYENLLRVER